jgi:hypothetical protein
VSNYTNYGAYDTINAVDGFVKWPSDVTPPEGSANEKGAILGYVSFRFSFGFPIIFRLN